MERDQHVVGFNERVTSEGIYVFVCLLALPFWELSPLLSSFQLSLQDHQLTGHLWQQNNKYFMGTMLGLEVKQDAKQEESKMPPQCVFQSLTSSYLRSASSAMCFASFSCISWISIFSSSFIARFSITFIPLFRQWKGFYTGTWQKNSMCLQWFNQTSRSHLRPSQPLPVSAVPRPASPGLGPTPPPPAGSYGSDLQHHPPPRRKRQEEESSLVIHSLNFYPSWSLPPFYRETGKERNVIKRAVLKQ